MRSSLLVYLVVICGTFAMADTTINGSVFSVISGDASTTTNPTSSTNSATSATSAAASLSTTSTNSASSSISTTPPNSSPTPTTSTAATSSSSSSAAPTSVSLNNGPQWSPGAIAATVVLLTFFVSGLAIIAFWQIRKRIEYRKDRKASRGEYARPKSGLHEDTEIPMVLRASSLGDLNQRREMVRNSVFETYRPISPAPVAYGDYDNLVLGDAAHRPSRISTMSNPYSNTGTTTSIINSPTQTYTLNHSQRPSSLYDGPQRPTSRTLHKQFSFEEEWPLQPTARVDQ